MLFIMIKLTEISDFIIYFYNSFQL